MNSRSSLLASPRAAGAATVTRTSSAFTPAKRKRMSHSKIHVKRVEKKQKILGQNDYVLLVIAERCARSSTSIAT